jgi:predicted RNA-binding Zn ribbon-like protein
MDLDVRAFPLLGEPVAVELANTRYESREETIDFLATSPWIVAWFDHAVVPSPVRMPRRLDRTQVDAVRAVRDAVHMAMAAVSVPGAPVPAKTVSTLNRYGSAVPCRYRLTWARGLPPTARVIPSGRGFDVAIAFLAIECVAFIAGADLARVRRCDAPDCPMFFVQRHHKRRFCHDGCAHRARQARYYRNQHPATRPTAGATR